MWRLNQRLLSFCIVLKRNTAKICQLNPFFLFCENQNWVPVMTEISIWSFIVRSLLAPSVLCQCLYTPQGPGSTPTFYFLPAQEVGHRFSLCSGGQYLFQKSCSLPQFSISTQNPEPSRCCWPFLYLSSCPCLLRSRANTTTDQEPISQDDQ